MPMSEIRWIEGVDLSQWNGSVDFRKLRDSGIEFVILRASVGARVDTKFQVYYLQARNTGLHIGTYWAWIPNFTIRAHLRALYEQVEDVQLDLPVFVDIEVPVSNMGVRNRLMLLSLKTVLQKEFKRPWGIYTSPNYARVFQMDQIPDLANVPLWLAHWNTKTPIIPKPWVDWAIWQYRVDHPGAVKGISTRVDRDRTTSDRLDKLLAMR
jgi:GH25 family lysozyme M1 (1,4-beta-N-acetylmuramidase)